MQIRPMIESDAGAVAALSTQLGYPSGAADIARRFALLAGDADSALYVAEAPDGQIIGWVHVHGRHLLEIEPFAEIGGLVVDAAWRGQGTGSALMAQAEQWAASRGYREVHVRSNSIRTKAHRFYHRLGYETIKSQHVFNKPLQAEA